jgi:hypothetical protein
MNSYTITITPDDTSRASTTLRVDLSGNAARITELLVRAGTATGLAAHQLPAVDLDLLLRAISPGGSPAAVRSAAGSVTHAEAASASVSESTAPTRGSTARRQRGGAKQAKAAKAAGDKPAKTARAAKKTGGERAYRRAPADLIQVFQQVGGVTAVARHYGVPRHTAQSWVRRLRNEGQLPAGS